MKNKNIGGVVNSTWSAKNNKKIFIHNLCFGLSKLYTNIQQDQKVKLDYHMSMLFAYMAGMGWGLEVLKCFVRGVRLFFYLLCVCVRGGGGGAGSVPLLP